MTRSRVSSATAVFLLLGAFVHAPLQAAAAPGGSYDDAANRLIEIGRDNLRQEEYVEALEMFESALVANPGSVDALIALGDAYHAIRRGDRSLRYYRQALRIEPNNRMALKAEALALIADDDLAGAEENLDRLRRICGEVGCSEIAQIERALADAESEATPEDSSAQTAQADLSEDGTR